MGGGYGSRGHATFHSGVRCCASVLCVVRHGEVRHRTLHCHHQLRMSRRRTLQGTQTMTTKRNASPSGLIGAMTDSARSMLARSLMHSLR